MGTVSAEDVILDENNVTDNSTSILNDTLVEDSSHTHEQLSKVLTDSPIKAATITASGGTLTQLQSIINGASSGDTINIVGDYTYNAGTDTAIKTTGISIDFKDLTINGNNYKIGRAHV